MNRTAATQGRVLAVLPGRSIGLGLAAGGLLAVVLLLACEPLMRVRALLAAGQPWSTIPFGLLLDSLAAAAVCGCGLWLAVVTLATVLEAATGASSAAVRAVSPALVRRLVLISCGAAVGGTGLVTPATAATHHEPVTRDVAHSPESGVLAGLALPDRAEGKPPPPPAVRTHVVRPGDSLWSVSAQLLPGDGPAVLDQTWRAIYRENRSAIGPDPNLILPGTPLRLPWAARRELPDPPDRHDASPHRKDAS